MKQNKYFGKRFALVSLGLLCALALGTAAADTKLQAVVQSYTANSVLQKGMIVKLAGSDSSQVEADTLDTAGKMSGVVVSPTDAPVTLSPTEGQSRQVYVAGSGRYNVLVSNQNGVIAPGDYVTVSSLAGVGMKADAHEAEVLGRAADGFDGIHGTEGSTTVKGQNGKDITVSLGRVAVDITIGPNPIALNQSNVPGVLQHAALLVTSKPVSAWRIYLSLVILVGTIIVAGSLLYGGAKNGMIAIGRNPLARSSIMRNLFQVVLTSVIIFVLGLFGVYLLLKL